MGGVFAEYVAIFFIGAELGGGGGGGCEVPPFLASVGTGSGVMGMIGGLGSFVEGLEGAVPLFTGIIGFFFMGAGLGGGGGCAWASFFPSVGVGGVERFGEGEGK